MKISEYGSWTFYDGRLFKDDGNPCNYIWNGNGIYSHKNRFINGFKYSERTRSTTYKGDKTYIRKRNYFNLVRRSSYMQAWLTTSQFRIEVFDGSNHYNAIKCRVTRKTDFFKNGGMMVDKQDFIRMLKSLKRPFTPELQVNK